jgi:hypothetical protein
MVMRGKRVSGTWFALVCFLLKNVTVGVGCLVFAELGWLSDWWMHGWMHLLGVGWNGYERDEYTQ